MSISHQSLGAMSRQRISLHRSSFLWAAWCFTCAIGIIGGLLFSRGISVSGHTTDLVVGSILCPLFLLFAWFTLLDTRAAVVVGPVEVRLRRGLFGWWRVNTDEVVYVELLQPLGYSQTPLGVVTFGWPTRWRLVIWKTDGTALVANRYGLPPDALEGWGPADLKKVAQAIRGSQGPTGRYGLPSMPIRQLIESFPARGRWPRSPLREL